MKLYLPITLLALATALLINNISIDHVRAAASDFDSSLIAKYSFDDGSNLGKDDSGNGNSGTVSGATQGTGKVGGGSLLLDGADDYVSLGDISGADNTTNFSVSAWVKSSQTTGQMNILSKQTSSTESWSLTWLGASGGFYGFNAYNSQTQGGTAHSALGLVPDNNWHHLVGVYDGTTIKLYYDGILSETQVPLTGTLKDTSLGVCVGTWSAGGGSCLPSSGNWNGLIDDVRLYSKALSCSEVRDLFALGGSSAPACGGSTGTGTGTGTPPDPTNPPTTGTDTTAPQVSITAPSSGTQSGIIAVSASASDNVAVAGVTFKVDGSVIGSEDTSSPYSVSLNTASLSNGPHTLTTVARDTSGLTTVSSSVSITVNNSSVTPVPYKTVSWTPPIGIPEPPFGIREDVSHYVLRSGTCADSANANKCFNYGNGLEPYRLNPQGEPYTHYVDGTNYPSNCVVNNDGSVAPFGSVEQPLCRLPLTLPPGSIVEVHGKFGKLHHQSPANVVARGTAQRPTYIRSTESDKAHITMPWDINGSYLILENLIFEDDDGDRSGGQVGLLGIFAPSDHISVRHSEFNGNFQNGGFGFSNSSPTPVTINNKYGVAWDNYVHDGGNPWAPTDSPSDGADRGGIFLAGKYMWALDNRCLRNGSTCVRTGGYVANDLSLAPAYNQYIFIGRNDALYQREANFWSKQATHVVFSQNKARSAVQAQAPSGKGGGMGFQYGPEDVWFLYNDISDVAAGIGIGSNLDDYGKNMYVIGNVIHNIHKHPTLDTVGAQAISIGGSINRYIVNNTIYDVDTGIRILNGGINEISGNLISDVPSTSGDASQTDLVHLYMQDEVGRSQTRITNNLFYEPGGSAKMRNAYGGWSLSDLNTTMGSGNIEADPKFVSSSDFRLQSGSAARDAGTATVMDQLASKYYTTFGVNIASDLASPYFKLTDTDIRKDFLSNNRPAGSAWDIGAYEYGATGGVQPPPSTVFPTNTPTVTPPPVTVDTLAPGILSVTAQNITANSATITWTTTELARSQVQYGTTVFFGSLTASTSLTVSPSLTLSSLSPNTLYSYRVISADASGNTSVTQIGTFSTLSQITPGSGTVTGGSSNGTSGSSSSAGSGSSHNVPPPDVPVARTKTSGSASSSTGSPCVPTSLPTSFTRTLQLGSIGTDVKSLQQFLNAKGFRVAQSGPGSPGFETSTFGPATKAAVVKFQIAQSITPASGLFGPITRAKVASLQNGTIVGCLEPAAVPVTVVTAPSSAFVRTLQMGSTGADVKALQQFLNKKGYAISTTGAGAPGYETTYFGLKLRAALIKFQIANNITPASGIFGPVTRAKVNTMR